MVVVTAGTGGAHKVLLISGKQSGSSGGPQSGFSRPISVVLPPATSHTSSDSDSNSSAGPPVRKRQRLTHLSPEEKALRRWVRSTFEGHKWPYVSREKPVIVARGHAQPTGSVSPLNPPRNGPLSHHANAELGQLTELISAKVSDLSTLIRTVKLRLGPCVRSRPGAGSNPGHRRLFSACVAGTWPVVAHSLVSSLERMCQFMTPPPFLLPPIFF